MALLHRADSMRNRGKTIRYATVKTLGAPIVDCEETGMILERAGLLILYSMAVWKSHDWTPYPVHEAAVGLL